MVQPPGESAMHYWCRVKIANENFLKTIHAVFPIADARK
jgi:hypothetical protein